MPSQHFQCDTGNRTMSIIFNIQMFRYCHHTDCNIDKVYTLHIYSISTWIYVRVLKLIDPCRLYSCSLVDDLHFGVTPGLIPSMFSSLQYHHRLCDHNDNRILSSGWRPICLHNFIRYRKALKLQRILASCRNFARRFAHWPWLRQWSSVLTRLISSAVSMESRHCVPWVNVHTNLQGINSEAVSSTVQTDHV